MSSRVFKAKTSHSPENPQLCGLTGNPIMKDDLCFYLVCDGDEARPDYQVLQIDEVEYQDRRGKTRTRKVYESKQGRPFRCAWTGEWETFKKADGKTGRRRVYEWQVEGPNGEMFPVDVWSNMVHASAAEALGFEVPRDEKGKLRMTVAHEGDRTQGHEHRISKDAENPLLTLARTVLSEEEEGKVAPASDRDAGAEIAQDSGPDVDPDEEDRLNAEALGITLAQYRKLVGR